MDTSKILPYIVPPGYVEKQAVSSDGLVRHLGHDVYVMLVHDLDRLCRNVLAEELEGITSQQLYECAIDNLIALVRSREIQMALMRGPRELPFAMAEGHWTAAACILLPRLYDLTAEQLQSTSLLACVPSRSSLLVFRELDDHYVKEMRGLMRKAERGEGKLVSNSLFKILPGRVEPYGATLPAPKTSLLARLFGA